MVCGGGDDVLNIAKGWKGGKNGFFGQAEGMF